MAKYMVCSGSNGVSVSINPNACVFHTVEKEHF